VDRTDTDVSDPASNPEPAATAAADSAGSDSAGSDSDGSDSDVEEAVDGAGVERWDQTVLAVLPYVVYILGAIYLMSALWRDPHAYMLADNYQDQVFFEWVLTNATNAVAHLHDPLFTAKLNAPYGINLMANTSVLAFAVPLAPLTATAGASVTFVLIETIAVAGTASAWYYVLNRLLNHRLAAAVGGLFCGFAPSMVSQTTGHPNIAAQFVLPFIILAVLRLREPGEPVRRGLMLAALVILQAFINEELLFLTALALLMFFIAYAAARPREVARAVPTALKTLGTAVLVVGVVLGYPLYRQFFGPGSYHGLPDYILAYGADLHSYWSFARRSIAGNPDISGRLAQGATEENSFFGWPLLLLLLAVVVWLRSMPVVRALVFTGLTFTALSLGSVIVSNGQSTNLPGPWGLVHRLPVFDSVVPTRLALVVTPVVGCLLAVAVSRLDGVADSLRMPDKRLVIRWLGIAVIGVALLPLTPTKQPAFDRPYVPPFFTAGTYRYYIPPNGVLLEVPPGWEANLNTMQWQTAANQDFKIYGGYYLARDRNDPLGRAAYGPPWPTIWVVLDQVVQSGQPVAVPDEQRAQIVAELHTYTVTTVVLAAHHPSAAPVREMVDQLLGPGELVDGMWLWKVP
jgi:hypothetical protein